jgi:hypothetical protein
MECEIGGRKADRYAVLGRDEARGPAESGANPAQGSDQDAGKPCRRRFGFVVHGVFLGSER